MLDILTTTTNALISSLFTLPMTGEQIKNWRNDLELTQEEFADRLRVSRRTIGRVEKPENETKPISGILALLIERAVLAGDIPPPPKEYR